MDEILEFLRARWDEDEAKAQAVEDSSAPWHGQWEADGDHAVRTRNGWVLTYGHGGRPLPTGLADHIVLHDPARVLAEVAAHRAMLDDLLAMPHYAWDGRSEYGCPKFEDAEAWAELMGDQPQVCDCGRDRLVERMVRHLTAAYADHPDYRQEWKP